ncbi:MAG: sigma-70 family RNA polymerase sigma factor [Anaerolineae bacterium]|nr:sigma-70 family RNA polymerase sigma factor [Anaerolineae bacterium]
MIEPSTVVARADLELITLAQQGDRQAFGELVRRYRERVIGIVYRMCGDMQLAEDAAQEAFVRAWQQLPRYQPHAPFQSWLYRIALNRATDVLRADRETANVEDLPLVAPDIGPEAAAERNALHEQIRRAVLDLPEASRSVLILREYEGLSYKEIAETLSIPLGTVMSRLNYARGRLREWLSPWLEEKV